MKEQLLALLKTKFQGVQDATLERIAAKKADTVTEQSQLQTVVDGLTYQDVINSEADFRASQSSASALKKAVEEYEKKHNLKDGKPVEDPNPPKPPDPPKGDDMPAWAKALQETITKQNETISGLSKGRELESRKAQAAKLLSGTKIPESFRENRMVYFDFNSDTPLEDQVKAIESQYVEEQQAIVNSLVKEGKYTPAGGGGGEMPDAEFDSYLKDKFPEAQKQD